MSKQHVDPSKKSKERDPDLAAAEGAMKRAAQQARERARQVGSGVAVLKDGKIVEINCAILQAGPQRLSQSKAGMRFTMNQTESRRCTGLPSQAVLHHW